MVGKRAYELLSRLSFERMAGSNKEKDAVNILKAELEKLGLNPVVEEFPIDCSEITECRLETIEPFNETYDVRGYKMSGSTSPKGIEARFLYVEDALEQNLFQAKGKIVLINNQFNVEAYKRLVDAKVAGFITSTGSVYDNADDIDLDTRILRERMYRYGKIPGVTMHISKAMELVSLNPKKMKLVLCQNEGKENSQNLICEIKGTLYPDEVVCFTAHYDSVEFSSGAYDNGTGAVTIMELLRYYSENKPRRTVRFIWCGSEERGLLGSKAYVNSHEDELKKVVLNINLDMTGVILGRDIAVVTGENELVSYINYLGCEEGFPIKVRQGVYSSDSTPFADKGIPAVSFARISSNGGATIHSKKDKIDFISSDYLEKMIEFVKVFSSRVINSIVFPVKKTIPANMKEELDKYLGRKDPCLEEVVEAKPVEVEKKEENNVEKDELLVSATSYLMSRNIISASKLQVEFYIGFQRATKILETLVSLGIIIQKDNEAVFSCSLDEALDIVNNFLEN